MYLNMSEINEPLSMDENSFQRMRNLKLLHFYKPWWWSRETGKGRLTLPDRGLHHFPRKLRLLRWDEYPSKCMPFNFRAESLVEIRMEYSKLEKLWEGTQIGPVVVPGSTGFNLTILNKLKTISKRYKNYKPFLGSLKEMDMSYSADLKEIPDLSKAINVKKLNLRGCKTLVALPSSIGNLSNLFLLKLKGCTSLVTLPSSIGNLSKLFKLDMSKCSNLKFVPADVNSESLLRAVQYVENVSSYTRNIEWLYLEETALEREEDSYWIENIPHLERLYWNDVPLSCMPPNFNPEYMKYLKMRGGRLKKLWGGVKSLENLSEMDLSGCESLVEIPDLSMAIGLRYPQVTPFKFYNCFSLDRDAQKIIIQSNPIMAVMPGGEVPMYFTHRASGSSLSILLSESSLSQEYIIIKACIVMRVSTFQEHSNSLYIQTAVNSEPMAPKLELSLGLAGASPCDPCPGRESLHSEPMIIEQQNTGTSDDEDPSFSAQLLNFFTLMKYFFPL
uniref:C-JID domain-containing protein n=1 Tax=Brassica oleracea var. oleracea TaxID=109376 RepID=A0A0D3AWW7_BRAOL